MLFTWGESRDRVQGCGAEGTCPLGVGLEGCRRCFSSKGGEAKMGIRDYSSELQAGPRWVPGCANSLGQVSNSTTGVSFSL